MHQTAFANVKIFSYVWEGQPSPEPRGQVFLKPFLGKWVKKTPISPPEMGIPTVN